MKAGGWSQGNNAEPVNSGRCCDECNMGVVIPARLGALGKPQATDESEEDTECWLYLFDHGGFSRVVGENDKWTTAHQMTGETGRLFAAAPDLLAALRLCCECLAEWVDSGSLYDDDLEAVKAARKAIAKAEGRSK